MGCLEHVRREQDDLPRQTHLELKRFLCGALRCSAASCEWWSAMPRRDNTRTKKTWQASASTDSVIFSQHSQRSECDSGPHQVWGSKCDHFTARKILWSSARGLSHVTVDWLGSLRSDLRRGPIQAGAVRRRRRYAGGIVKSSASQSLVARPLEV